MCTTVHICVDQEKKSVVLYSENLSQDDTTLVLPLTTVSCMSFFEQTVNMTNEEAANKWINSDTDLFVNSLQNNLSKFKVNVINHIAGYIQKQLQAKEQCIYCSIFLSNMKIVHGGMLLNRKKQKRANAAL